MREIMMDRAIEEAMRRYGSDASEPEKHYRPKKLKWKRYKGKNYDLYQSTTPPSGSYQVVRYRAVQPPNGWGPWQWETPGGSEHPCNDPKDGKAAAEAHWLGVVLQYVEEVCGE